MSAWAPRHTWSHRVRAAILTGRRAHTPDGRHSDNHAAQYRSVLKCAHAHHLILDHFKVFLITIFQKWMLFSSICCLKPALVLSLIPHPSRGSKGTGQVVWAGLELVLDALTSRTEDFPQVSSSLFCGHNQSLPVYFSLHGNKSHVTSSQTR